MNCLGKIHNLRVVGGLEASLNRKSGWIPVGFPAQDSTRKFKGTEDPRGSLTCLTCFPPGPWQTKPETANPRVPICNQPLSTPLVGRGWLLLPRMGPAGFQSRRLSVVLTGQAGGIGAPLAPASQSQNAAKSITQFEAKIQKFAVQGVGGVACGGIGVVLWLDLVIFGAIKLRRRQNGPAEKLACGEGEHLAFEKVEDKRFWREKQVRSLSLGFL